MATTKKMQRYFDALPEENTQRALARYQAAQVLRIKRGQKAVNVSSKDEPQTMLCDLLTDLLHWVDYMKANPSTDWQDAQEVDFDHALEMALEHHAAERLGED